MSSTTWGGRWNGLIPVGDAHRRSRTIVRHTGGIVRGKFPSRKNGRMIHHEGLLELDAIYLFEASPRIVRYREQMPVIRYADGARLRRYTPDFEVVLDTGETITVEVKAARSVADAEISHKIDCIQTYYRRRGEVFAVLTEEILRQEPRQSNLRWIYHQIPRVSPTAEAIRFALSEVRQVFPTSLRHLVTLLEPRAVDPFSALIAGFLHCRLDVPVSLDTEVELTKEDSHAWIFTTPKLGF